jgi:N utilization substance protein B
MTKRHERTLARRMAVQVLYQSEITGQSVCEIADGGSAVPDGGALPEYAIALLKGTEGRKDEIDAKLADASENWALDRMPIVDRAILRLAVFEMLYVDDVPVPVCINEAVELAKSFGGEDESARFANGILGRIARTDESVASVADDSASGPAAISADGSAAQPIVDSVGAPIASVSAEKAVLPAAEATAVVPGVEAEPSTALEGSHAE